MNRTVLALALAVLATPAFANAVISEFPAGGVVFKEAADIAIMREDLHISLDQIDVHYDYKSDAAATQHVTIGFPMPPIPIDGGPDDPESMPDLEGKDLTNYMLFSAKVDGKPVATTLHGFAWYEGVNITSELEAMGIPPYLTAEQGNEVFARVAPGDLDALEARGIIYRDSDHTYVVANWLYQSVFEWQQDFAPGVTKVDIAYRPLSAYPSDIGDYYETDPDGRYCIGDTVRKAINDYRAQNVSYEVQTVGYITTTATYWKGAIGAFNLTIDKVKPDLDSLEVGGEMSFCHRGEFTETPDSFTWSTKDFVPKEDIRIVWYHFYDYSFEEESQAQ